MISEALEVWETPTGELVARVYEEYLGLRGQRRVGLVDCQGRVFHYDEALVTKRDVGGSDAQAV